MSRTCFDKFVPPLCNMNVLVIGSGGREHAICRSFSKSNRVARLFCANGNAGIAEIAERVAISPDNIAALTRFAAENRIDLTFVGGETPLALGIVDEFESRGLRIIGPSRQAARLEASKSFAKDFMARHGVPTAEYVAARTPEIAIEALENGYFGDARVPVVVKADGLAAGKGVVVARNRAEAVAAVYEMAALVGPDAAERIVLEECLVGKEVSLLMFADGEDFALMPPTRDHKRIGDGDTGPNTGGMGTITDASLLTAEEINVITDKIIRPTLAGCRREGFPFRGILFLGLMMVECGEPVIDRVSSPTVREGSLECGGLCVSKGVTSNVASNALANAQASAPVTPMLLEYNVRFGDPETQAILVRLETDLVDICEAMLQCGGLRVSKGETANVASCALANAQASASGLADLDIQWRPGSSACVVLASQGYPATPQMGDAIVGLEDAKTIEGVEVFHAGTALSEPPALAGGLTQKSRLVTSGGRILGVTATGNDLANALEAAYKAVDKISFDGMQYRRDIGR